MNKPVLVQQISEPIVQLNPSSPPIPSYKQQCTGDYTHASTSLFQWDTCLIHLMPRDDKSLVENNTGCLLVRLKQDAQGYCCPSDCTLNTTLSTSQPPAGRYTAVAGSGLEWEHYVRVDLFKNLWLSYGNVSENNFVSKCVIQVDVGVLSAYTSNGCEQSVTRENSMHESFCWLFREVRSQEGPTTGCTADVGLPHVRCERPSLFFLSSSHTVKFQIPSLVFI